MALTVGALKTCAHALGTCMPTCIDRSAKLFFMLETRGPEGALGHMAALELT
jgi:hypothetical protein